MSEPIRVSYGTVNEKWSPKADILNIWSPPDDAVWGAYRTSRGQSLDEERLSLWVGFEDL